MHIEQWKARVRDLRADTHALYLAWRDPRLGLPARLVIICVVAYALSPIDLIPDFIPVFGLLDDLIILPLGIMLAVRLIPPQVMAEARAQARDRLASRRPGLFGAAAVILVWAALAALAAWWVSSLIGASS